MRNKKERKGKAEIRWDFVGGGGWMDKEVTFTDYHQTELRKICNVVEFVTAINRIAGEYLSKQKPEAPTFARFNQEYRKEWVRPTVADIRATLLDLQEIENKVSQLDGISICHPVWDTIQNAWYEEHKTMIHRDYFKKISFLADFKNMLDETPKDHPEWQRIQDIWEAEHKKDFEKMNTEIIPYLIEVSLKHLQFSYMTETTDSAGEKRFLAMRLAYVLKRFGFKPSQTKDGNLSKCIEIVLDAVGQPTKTAHKYIIPEMVKQLKKIAP